ncbi:glycoside hydrolase family 19 protein [Corallococcus silvisoli]|uniref:glycoside hydrolase family 19 protein n=1 Tax=Corallococcus silvisoli TaxID=2697031 RepID=UPI0013776C89|nr:glycoside hydrolase family 19 protein [Corallococcus silvisoli]NBD09631.1 glycoside hydrolase family 19 protein [Corallococcus silvisoli]
MPGSGVLLGGAALVGLGAWAMRGGAAAAPLTVDQLCAVMPRLTPSVAASYLGPLLAAMREAEVTTVARVAAFLAQLAHESGELRYWEELATGDAYEGRKDLGNTQPGDGRRYKGRGPIQLTGRANYRAAGAALGLPLEDKPELAALPAHGFRVAGWYWQSRHLNALADVADFVGVTRAINGGTNGLDNRVMYFDRAQRVLKTEAA